MGGLSTSIACTLIIGLYLVEMSEVVGINAQAGEALGINK
jgi:hypothetical protein